MDIKQIMPIDKELINVVIETPRHTASKYVYVNELNMFRLKKILPPGMVFPFDFGFVPNTVGGDGDPLDVLVIMDEAGYPGCIVPCRPLGVLKAMQKEGCKPEVDNDRIIAIADSSNMYRSIQHISQLNVDMISSIKIFFINYNVQEGEEFEPKEWGSAEDALSLVGKSIIKQS